MIFQEAPLKHAAIVLIVIEHDLLIVEASSFELHSVVKIKGEKTL